MKILRPGQLAVQPRRTGFERVLGARNQIFHVQQNSKITAESGTILVGNPRKLLQTVGTQRAFPELLNEPLQQSLVSLSGVLSLGLFSRADRNRRLQPRPLLSVFLKINAQGTLLRRADELNVHYLQPM